MRVFRVPPVLPTPQLLYELHNGCGRYACQCEDAEKQAEGGCSCKTGKMACAVRLSVVIGYTALLFWLCQASRERGRFRRLARI